MNGKQLLAATNRPYDLVSRDEEMGEIKRAIFDEGDDCRIILLKGDGGLGKTRILEEVSCCLGDKDLRKIYGEPVADRDWSLIDNAPAGAMLMDFTDIRFHTREYFMNQLADSRTWAGKFRFQNYVLARDRWQRLTDSGSAFSLLESAADEAEKAFWQDYRLVAGGQRLVIMLDTVEQLAIISSSWLLEHGLLQSEDFMFNTQQWLLEKIANGHFPNTTLVISGRDREEEGGPYFDLLQDAVDKTNGKSRLIPVKLRPFDQTETRAYFQALYNDWTKFLASPDTQETAQYILSVLEALLTNEERLNVLWLYTGGQPIRLSLYTDILVEGQTVPAPLQDSWKEAQERTKSDGSEETDALLATRRQIETKFIQILFMSNDLRAQILRTLAQAYNGLTAKELLFALDDDPDISVHDWLADPEKLKEFEKNLEDLQRLSIVKPKPRGRTGLQDEMYRIYAEVMSADPQTRDTERDSRQRMYQRLSELASNRLRRLSKEDESLIREDLNRIRVERPSNVLSTRMPPFSEVAEQKRQTIATDMFNTELDFLHYSLLLNPEINFNDVYYKLANSTVKDLNEVQFSMFTAELWRVIQNKYAFKFINLQSRGTISEQSQLFQVLHRAAQVVDAASWIIRYSIRGNYKKAIVFADALEQVIVSLADPVERYSWSHTLSWGERVCWREYAQILNGQDIQKSVKVLNDSVSKLVRLSRVNFDTIVFSEKGEKGERGFVGHPAFNRLLYIIGLTYNVLGYGSVNLGDFDNAVKEYANALKYFRRLSSSANPDVLEASIRNNLSRVLVEMGKGRSIRICQDALELRIKIGDWLPIALSYNTLGLIYNDLYRPQEALAACATAYAVAQKFAHPRVIGLVLIQLSEALRRLASLELSIRQDSPIEIYHEAERAIQQAREIFLESSASQESIRLVEINIETGCLYRDWLGQTDKSQSSGIWQRRYEDALFYLKEAVKVAKKLKISRLTLDAQVNLAWTYYVAHAYEAAENALRQAEQLVSSDAHFHANNTQPPDPDKHDSYIFKQLSKAMGLYGLIALEQYMEKLEILQARIPGLSQEKRDERRLFVRDNEELQTLLKKTTSYYVRALGYAQLFAPRSPALTVIYNKLYAFLKQLNRRELEDFYEYSREAITLYKTEEIKIRNLGNLSEFLLDNFGDYNEPEPSIPISEGIGA